MITRDSLIEFFTKENELFSFEEFFKDGKDKRAIIVVTPNKVIKTRNILDNSNETSGHDITYDYLTFALYNIMFDKNGVLSYDEQEIENNKYVIEYLQYHQNIMIRMCNEGVNHVKLVWIHIPPKVTTTQLNLLKDLNSKTRDLFKSISNSFDNDDYLVAFNDSSCKTVKGDTLDIAIEYIINNNLINDTDPVIEEDYIIGDNIDYGNKQV